MVRGRKGPMDQSERKPKLSRISEERKGALNLFFFYAPKSEEKELFLTEEVDEIMKNMNPQQLVNFLMPNEDWHMKDSTVNSSGS